MSSTAAYVHGHQEPVLQLHSWRTAANSAAYLLPSLKPHMHILDIGCGPGTITIDLATLVPQGQVVGLELTPEPLERARAIATERGINNVRFVTGDAHALPFPDASFDVVHAHQVLQHLHDPAAALREMRRVARPGGLIAARDADVGSMVWYPESEAISAWRALHFEVSRADGGHPEGGRRLLAWALEAGFGRADVAASAGTWCFSTPEERTYWGGLMADRMVGSGFAQAAIVGGHAGAEELARIAQGFREWSVQEDGWFGVLHSEIVCRVA